MLESLVRNSIGYLESFAAKESLRLDPYWPKWDSPWWHMTLLWEMGLADRIPPSIVESLTSALQYQYLDFFPFEDSEIPAGKSEQCHVLCHCALGTIDQVLRACGIDIWQRLPWTRDWYSRYQLPDGGLNCEKDAYLGSKKSSIVSTVPCLEAVLSRQASLSPEEKRFLDRGVRYLIEHRLVRSRKGIVIDPNWLKPCFPRFYEYDVLRGAAFLFKWSEYSGEPVPAEVLEDARPWLEGKPIRNERYALGKNSIFIDSNGFRKGPASVFPLLERVSIVDAPCPFIQFPTK